MSLAEIMICGAYAAKGVLIFSICLVTWRLIKGPSLYDRVIALDLLTVMMAGAIALQTLITGHTYYLTTAMIAALTAFLGTVAFAHYLERQAKK